jgi:hypothetical protein
VPGALSSTPAAASRDVGYLGLGVYPSSGGSQELARFVRLHLDAGVHHQLEGFIQDLLDQFVRK